MGAQAINELDGFQLFTQGFAFKDIIGQERWISFVPVFTSLTVFGATTYLARWRPLGHTNVSCGGCVVDVTNSRIYLPTQPASNNVFVLTGWSEI